MKMNSNKDYFRTERFSEIGQIVTVLYSKYRMNK